MCRKDAGRPLEQHDMQTRLLEWNLAFPHDFSENVKADSRVMVGEPPPQFQIPESTDSLAPFIHTNIHPTPHFRIIHA